MRIRDWISYIKKKKERIPANKEIEWFLEKDGGAQTIFMLESPHLSWERSPATLPSAPCPKRLTCIVQELVHQTCQEFFTPSYKCNLGIMREKESSWLISFVQTADCYDCLPPDYATSLQGRMKISWCVGKLKWGNKENTKSFSLYIRSHVLTLPKHAGSMGMASGRGHCPYFMAISSVFFHAEPSDSLSSFLWHPYESLWSQVKAVSDILGNRMEMLPKLLLIKPRCLKQYWFLESICLESKASEELCI